MMLVAFLTMTCAAGASAAMFVWRSDSVKRVHDEAHAARDQSWASTSSDRRCVILSRVLGSGKCRE